MRYVLMSILICASSGLAQAQAPTRDPAAVALIEQSISAHASGPAQARLSFRGTTTSPDQSETPDGPVRPHPWLVDVAIDEAAQSIAMASDIGIDGDLRFPRKIGFAGGKGFATRYTGEYDLLTDMPAEANGQLPHLLLKSVLKNAESLSAATDRQFDRVTYRLATGPETSLLLDHKTHLLFAQRRAPIPTAFGDRSSEIVYGPYRRVGALMVPQSIAFRFKSPALGQFEYALDLVAARVGGPTANELQPPAGSQLRRPPSMEFTVERYGDRAFLLRNAGSEGQFAYNVLVVPFADHVLVVEAALNDATSRKVIEEVGKLAPGKPIRTLVQTHHHGDHIGGIRTYIAQDVQILAPAGTRGFIQRIAAAHSEMAPDALASAPRAPRIEEVAADRTIADATNEVRLLTYPNDHSGGMLIVYLPRQKLLYQGDMISAGELPLYGSSRAFLRWVRARKLDVTALAGLHGRTVADRELANLLYNQVLRANPPRGN